mgnify:CR=1 FL=1
MTERFDGFIDNREVKVIIRVNSNGEKMISAKAKNNDIDTPDFREYQNVLTVHQDSSGAIQYRVMDTPMIGSMYLPAGLTFLNSSGAVTLVLPMTKDNENFQISTSPSGANIVLNNAGYVLVAFGTFGEWEYK